jgi:hypothetical protein
MESKELYLVLTYVVSYLFLSIYINNNEIFLYAAVLAFILYTFQKSIKLCGVMLVIFICYIIKRKGELVKG